MSTILPAGTGHADFFIPPRPAWARAEVHERFWRVVGRAVERAALPPSVWSADPDPDDMAQDEEPAADEGGLGEHVKEAGANVD